MRAEDISLCFELDSVNYQTFRGPLSFTALELGLPVDTVRSGDPCILFTALRWDEDHFDAESFACIERKLSQEDDVWCRQFLNGKAFSFELLDER